MKSLLCKSLLPLALLVVTGLTASAQGTLKVAAIFGDHMVLQRNVPLVFWGQAREGMTVRLSFAGQTGIATADTTGAWRIRLSPVAPSQEGQPLRFHTDEEEIVFHDVLVGEVWHASGQSNMEMKVNAVAARLPQAQEDLANAHLPAIRFRRIGSNGSPTPLPDLAEKGHWVVSTPDTAPTFSAAAFYFARELHAKLGVPVGVIDTSRGGTPIEPFIPREAFSEHPTLQRELALGDAGDLDGIWRLPGGVYARDENWLPGRLFHSRVAPITDFAARGLIWYQGESNCGTREDPRDYRHKMAALVKGWRMALHSPDMPVYFVQLPGSGAGPGWPYLREEQRRSASLPHTGMVVTIDLLDADIHPPNKIDVGKRLARWALANTYGKSLPFSGPLFRETLIADGRVTVHFDHAERGLMVAIKEGLTPPQESADQSLALFEVADADGTWHTAHAEILDKTVVVHHEAVPDPRAVRYAFAVSPPHCRLYNRDGLPASPFCSDERFLDYDPNLPTE